MCIWGVQLARFISSLAFAAVLGYATHILTYGLFHSVALSILFTILAIFIGFIIGFTLFKVALSIVFGYAISTILVRGAVLTLLMTIVLAAVIYILSSNVLAVLFAATGASLVYKSTIALGLQPTIALIIAILIGVVGVYNQLRRRM